RRELQVLFDIELWEEVATGALPDVPHRIAAIDVAIPAGQVVQVVSGNDRMAGGGAVDSSKNIHECGFAATAGANNCDQFAGPDVQIETLQGNHLKLRGPVDVHKPTAIDNGGGRVHPKDLNSIMTSAEAGGRDTRAPARMHAAAKPRTRLVRAATARGSAAFWRSRS